jgi:hypothetical protein
MSAVYNCYWFSNAQLSLAPSDQWYMAPIFTVLPVDIQHSQLSSFLSQFMCEARPCVRTIYSMSCLNSGSSYCKDCHVSLLNGRILVRLRAYIICVALHILQCSECLHFNAWTNANTTPYTFREHLSQNMYYCIT